MRADAVALASIRIVASAAAIGAAAIQNEPVAKICRAPSRQRLGAQQRGERIPVGERLAPRAEVRPDPERLPAAAQVDPQAAADVVEDQRRADAIADLAHAAGERRIGELLVAVDVVADAACTTIAATSSSPASRTAASTEARSL